MEGNCMPEKRNFTAGALACAVLLIVLGAALGYLGAKYRLSKQDGPEPEMPPVLSVSSEESSPAEEVAEPVSEPEALTPAEESLAENLGGIVGAAIPNVGAYAAHMQGRGHTVCIDPGHQDHAMTDTEPIGPGSQEMKAKLTTGTQGRTTGRTEYEINLEIGLILEGILKDRGYGVVMTRRTNDVNISNAERAVMAADCGADVFIRLHCNGSDNSSVSGALAYQPTYSNAYLSSEVIGESQRLAGLVLEHQVSVTGQNSLGLIAGDDMTGINWASMPVVIIEMGYMSNPEEDRFLVDREGQTKIAEGIADGIDAFFSEGETQQ